MGYVIGWFAKSAFIWIPRLLVLVFGIMLVLVRMDWWEVLTFSGLLLFFALPDIARMRSAMQRAWRMRAARGQLRTWDAEAWAESADESAREPTWDGMGSRRGHGWFSVEGFAMSSLRNLAMLAIVWFGLPMLFGEPEYDLPLADAPLGMWLIMVSMVLSAYGAALQKRRRDAPKSADYVMTATILMGLGIILSTLWSTATLPRLW